MTMNATSRLACLALAAALMTGCGAQAVPGAADARVAAAAEAQATKTLKDGFKHVYGAAFQKLDANADHAIDEYEAGPFIDLRDMVKADSNKNGKLTEKEFTEFATRGGLFGLFHQNPDSFFKSHRRSMLKAFDKLDANKNHLLSPAELGDAAVTATKLSLTLPGLKTTVALTTFSEEAFKANDKTGDGNLGQAEFEDYALNSFTAAINPKYVPSQPAPPAPPAPAPVPGEEG